VGGCCVAITGKCTGNTDWRNNVNCGTGYKMKTTYSTKSGTTVDECCDQKTCADLECALTRRQAKTNPTQPNLGNNPTVTGCCVDITGQCTGNTALSNNVNCGTGYKMKTTYNTKSGTTRVECCDQKTCADLDCALTKRRAKTNPTQPNMGNEPTVGGCCEPITGMCAGNFNPLSDVTCHAELFWKDKANKASITGSTAEVCCDAITDQCLSWSQRHTPYSCRAGEYAHSFKECPVTAVTAVDCVNDNFDVIGVEGVLSKGPMCPAKNWTPQAGDPSFTSSDNEKGGHASTSRGARAVSTLFPATMTALALISASGR